MDQIRRLW